MQIEQPFPMPSNESARLEALKALLILDTPPEQEFDRLTRLAAHISGVPIAAITLIDERRQWFKSIVGMDAVEMDRTVALCAHAIVQDDPMILEDASQDSRFASNPLITGQPGIRFYGCVPLTTAGGFNVGTLAVVDLVPKSLTQEQSAALATLASQVVLQLETRLQRFRLEEALADRDRAHTALQKQTRILRTAGKVARIGGWIADLRRRVIDWELGAAELHEEPEGTASITFEEVQRYYEEPWRSHLFECFARCAKEGIAFDEEMFLLTRKGRRIAVRVMGEPEYQDSTVVAIHGVVQDVQSAKEAQRNIERSKQSFWRLADTVPQIVWTADVDGVINFANRAMYRYVGTNKDRHGKLNWLDALHPDDVESSSQKWQAATQTGERYQAEYRLKSFETGEYRWMLAQAEPVRDEQGEILEWYGTVTDVHDVRASQEKLEELSRELAVILGSISDGLLMVDNYGKIRYCNLNATQLLGLTATNIVGQSWIDLESWLSDRVPASNIEVALRTQSARSFEYAVGEPKRWIECRVFPAAAETKPGQTTQQSWTLYLRDVTARKAEQELLRLSEERFKLVSRATADTIWDWNLVTGKVWWSEGLQRQFGHPRDEGSRELAAWTAWIHPDDLERIEKTLVKVFSDPEETQWQYEYRFMKADRSYAQVEDRGFVIRDATGFAIRMVGGMTDITAVTEARRRASREALLRARLLQIQQEVSGMSSASLIGVCQWMAEQALAVLEASGLEIELCDENELVCFGAAGTNIRGVGTRIPIVGSFGGLAVSTGEVQYCPDAMADSRVMQQVAQRLRAVSILAAPLRSAGHVIGIVRATSPEKDAYGQDQITSILTLAESLGSVLARLQAVEKLRESERQYRQLFSTSPHPMWVYEQKSMQVLAANSAACTHYGYTEDEFRELTVADFWPDAQRIETEQEIGSSLLTPEVNALHRHITRHGKAIDVEVSVSPILFDGATARLAMAVDVTTRLQAERELRRLARAQRMLSACNEYLVRADSEHALLNQICRLVVEVGGYRQAWVGFAAQDGTMRNQIVASYGAATEILENFDLSWDPDHPASHGPTGRAIHSKQVVIVESVENDPTVELWRDQLIRAGMLSAIGLPLLTETRVLGAMCLYGSEPAPLGAEERQLLEELANDLAFGIQTLRTREQQRRLQNAVTTVAKATSTARDRDFFRSLVRAMAESVGACAGFISIFPPDPNCVAGGPPTKAKTIAAVMDGELVEDFEYLLADAPGQHVWENSRWSVETAVQDKYPNSVQLRKIGAESYVGQRLDASDGTPLGLLFVLFREPLSESSIIGSVMQIFADRVASELEREATDKKIRDQASLLDKAQDAIIVRNLEHEVLYWNKSAERMYGWRMDEIAGKPVSDFLYRQAPEYFDAMQRTLADGEWTGELIQYRRDGAALDVEVRWTLVRDAESQPVSVLAIGTDITARKIAEAQVERLAYFDPLTGLPNRQRFNRHLDEVLQVPSRREEQRGLMLVNLDNFKTLNETISHAAGDAVLKAVGGRLERAVGTTGYLARLGADEFAILIQVERSASEGPREQLIGLAVQFLNLLNEPFGIGSLSHAIDACIGLVVLDDPNVKRTEALQQAGMALNHAKSSGRNTIKGFEPAMEAYVKERATLEAELRLALDRDELVLHYQPQLTAKGEAYGAEALIRWEHPERGMISPAKFIPLAEETGLIVPIGAWVLTTACAVLRQWQSEEHTKHLILSVNVSAIQFRHPEFLTTVSDALSKSGIDPKGLKLELTESLMIYDIEGVLEKMYALRELGLAFSLDDFGTGYSSLSYLRRLPLDQLKIDQAFTKNILSSEKDLSIVKTIIELGHSLNLYVVAEGVEEETQLSLLKALGCNAFQGYLHSKPVPLSQAVEFMLRHTSGRQ